MNIPHFRLVSSSRRFCVFTGSAPSSSVAILAIPRANTINDRITGQLRRLEHDSTQTRWPLLSPPGPKPASLGWRSLAERRQFQQWSAPVRHAQPAEPIGDDTAQDMHESSRAQLCAGAVLGPRQTTARMKVSIASCDAVFMIYCNTKRRSFAAPRTEILRPAPVFSASAFQPSAGYCRMILVDRAKSLRMSTA